jgi:hypothetical protein
LEEEGRRSGNFADLSFGGTFLKKINDLIWRFPKEVLSLQQQGKREERFRATFFDIPILNPKIHPQRAVRTFY